MLTEDAIWGCFLVVVSLTPYKTAKRRDYQSERKKKAYCFLPLPIETGLPAHVNGHFALDHETRRHLWTDKTDDYRSKWNEALVKDVIALCYLALLDEVRNFHQLPVTRGEEEAIINCQQAYFGKQCR